MEAILERRTTTVQNGIAVKLSWAWAVGFVLPGILGFIPNPVLGPDSLFVTNTAHNLVHLITAVAFLGVSSFLKKRILRSRAQQRWQVSVQRVQARRAAAR